MRLKKKGCNCNGIELTKSDYNDFLFSLIQSANKEGKDYCAAKKGSLIVGVSLVVAEFAELKIYAKIPQGLKSLNDVEHLERPI